MTIINGITITRNENGLVHREDGPAIERANGDKFWYIKGHLHRDAGPAITKKSGFQQWYQNGKIHREDGPAAIYSSFEGVVGASAWYWEGILLDEKSVTMLSKHKKFLNTSQSSSQGFKNSIFNSQGLLHCVDGPAVSWADETREWWINGQRHRQNGPAIVFPNGDCLYYLFNTPKTKSQVEYCKPMSIETNKVTAEEPKKETPVIKSWPEDPSELIQYEEIWTPFKAILEKGYILTRKMQEWTFEYSGYDIGKMEKRILPSIKEQVSEKYLRREKEKHDRTLMDVVMRSIFLMGIEQGRRMAYQEQVPVKELQKTLENYRERNKSTRYQLAKAQAEIRIRDENPTANNQQIHSLVKIELEKTRQIRVAEIRKELSLDPTVSCFRSKLSKKKRLPELLSLANSLDEEIVSFADWTLLLNEAGCSIGEWRHYAKKKSFNRFLGPAE